ncbi:MAG: DEAD/DEAH box helicase [Firmicutes bacterium]|nr:DEAD/DEAH box helicase [Bacillota bacterium]
MNIDNLINELKSSNKISKNITNWKVIPKREGKYKPYPKGINKNIIKALERKGIDKLYSHQYDAIKESLKGNNTVIVTPTASGKTLCYNIPILNSIVNNKNLRALYLFPTKALSQDQVSDLFGIIQQLDEEIKTFTYDGDTNKNARQAIRKAGHIVITNPDMLHSGILPHHTKWVKLFENLEYIVIDEIHHYKGVFGSHVANVLRRLKRICKFYGTNPKFICCSATIANPKELAENLVENNFKLIDNNGSPSGEKHFIFYNPPVVNRELGIRKSALLEANKLAKSFLYNNIQTIFFTRSRKSVEVMTSYLMDTVEKKIGSNYKVTGYRGGYLPNERRKIEKGLRKGEILGVVSTNALELGIDIGSLDASIIIGYPGSISSTWQQAGRAGRKSKKSVSLLITTSNPLDQYIANNPDYFFKHSTEKCYVNPNNLIILFNHIRCAAFELPFKDGEKFGIENTIEVLNFLEEENELRHVEDMWYWMSDVFPAENISLRSASNENFVIIDISKPKRKVIGEIDRFSAPLLLHEQAIYIHLGKLYQVNELDYNNKTAFVKQADVDYYTDASLSVDLNVLNVLKESDLKGIKKYIGEVSIRALVTMYKKIKFHTHENIGWGKVNLPEQELQTTAFWFEIPKNINMSNENLKNAMLGISNVLVNITPIYLMCDPRDINSIYHVKSPFTNAPTIYIYDTYPGGIGLSEKLYELSYDLLVNVYNLIKSCKCISGCPSCVGPVEEVGENGKQKAINILEVIFKNESKRKINKT